MNIKDIFPKASKSFIEANKAISGGYQGTGATLPIPDEKTPSGPSGSGKGIRTRMNKTEAEFALRLEAQRQRGEILRAEFQGITLRWFDMRYTPDFFVLVNTVGEKDLCELYHDHHQIKLIEVKGPHIHYRQQALARFKGARGFWPEFTFELHQKTKEGWRQIL